MQRSNSQPSPFSYSKQPEKKGKMSQYRAASVDRYKKSDLEKKYPVPPYNEMRDVKNMMQGDPHASEVARGVQMFNAMNDLTRQMDRFNMD